MTRVTHSSKAARFAYAQVSFDFDTYEQVTNLKEQNAAQVKALQIDHAFASQFTAAFIRMQSNPKGMYEHKFLCSCGEHWSVKTDEVGTDLCPHCHKELDPYATNNGDLTEQQLENLLIAERFRVAFMGTDVGFRVFDSLIAANALVKFSPKSVYKEVAVEAIDDDFADFED